MESATLILASQQDALRRAIDIVANNVANTNTTGFKRQDIQFDTLLKQPAPNERYNFVIDRATYRNTAMGPLSTTGNPFDLAIQGEGYFQVQTKAGTRYVRGGAFQLNSEGEIVTASGDKLLSDGGQPISVSSDIASITVSGDGMISGKSTGSEASAVQLGKLKIVKFAREQELQQAGTGLYSTTQTPVEATDSKIVQGMLERSNVDPVLEVTRMIDVLRSYQQTVRMMERESQRMDSAIQKLSRATA